MRKREKTFVNTSFSYWEEPRELSLKHCLRQALSDAPVIVLTLHMYFIKAVYEADFRENSAN